VRRTLSFAAAWVVAAVLALVVAWQGVSVVADQVTNRRPAPLGAEEVRRQLESEQAAAATTTLAPATSVAPATAPAPPTTAPPVPASSSPPVTTAPPPSSSPAASAVPPPASAVPPPASAVPPPATEAPPATETRTYNLVGGSAALSFSPGGVSVVFATPEPGFEVDVEPQNGNGVRVEFESEDHRSRVDAWWEGGPQERVREEPD
jgi:hypothetical protein